MKHHQVVIIGAGPSGLLLARQLSNRGVNCMILENRNERFLRRNNRGGFLEHNVVELLEKEKASHQIKTKGVPLSKIHFHIQHKQIPLSLIDIEIDKNAFIYDQQNIVADLLEGLKADDIPILFEAKAQRYEGLTEEQVKIIYTFDGQLQEMTCDYVIGCDGFRGISRRTIPSMLRQEIKEELPYAWLEWIVADRSNTDIPIIAFHQNGFAMQMPTVNGKTRFYLQLKRGLEMDDLPSEDILWEDVENRLGEVVNRGKMDNKKLDYMRLYFTKSLQHGRLFIVGDAAHIVPRFGSKGINLAFSDATKLSTALANYYTKEDSILLDNYSQDCLQDNEQTIQYTNYLNHLFHKKESDTFDAQISKIYQLLNDDKKQLALIQYLVG